MLRFPTFHYFLLILVSGCLWLSCKPYLSGTAKEASAKQNQIHTPNASTVNSAQLPLYLDKINFQNSNNWLQVNEAIVQEIEHTLATYYSALGQYDSLPSTFTLKDIYLNTIRLPDSLQTIFLVLVKHFPTNQLHGVVLFYDNKEKIFLKNHFDFDLSSLYDIEEDVLNPSNLKKELNLHTPEIQVVDYNQDGVRDFQFTRLVHNGTYNALQTLILSIHQNQLDTLLLNESPL